MSTSTAKHRVRDAYFDLIHAFPLRPIRTHVECERAISVLLKLAKSKPVEAMEAGERDYFEALTMLVQRFERDRGQSSLPKLTPIERLKFLMEQRAMTVGELARVLGSQPNASLILHGKRSMSKEHIVKLARHFAVSPALFLV